MKRTYSGIKNQYPSLYGQSIEYVPPNDPNFFNGTHQQLLLSSAKLGESNTLLIQPTSATGSGTLLNGVQPLTTQYPLLQQEDSFRQMGNTSAYENTSVATKSGASNVSNESDVYGSGGDEEDGDDIDWRLQIYYWVGRLELACSESGADSDLRFCWHGCWLGSFTGKPSEEEFATSSNEFEYISDPISTSTAHIPLDYMLLPRTGGEGAKIRVSLPEHTSFKGYYMMESDTTGKPEKNFDKDISIHLYKERDITHPSSYLVVGRGESDFGVFVLHGVWDTVSCTMEMRRQYVADTDPRSAMSLDEYKLHLLFSGSPV